MGHVPECIDGSGRDVGAGHDADVDVVVTGHDGDVERGAVHDRTERVQADEARAAAVHGDRWPGNVGDHEVHRGSGAGSRARGPSRPGRAGRRRSTAPPPPARRGSADRRRDASPWRRASRRAPPRGVRPGRRDATGAHANSTETRLPGHVAAPCHRRRPAPPPRAACRGARRRPEPGPQRPATMVIATSFTVTPNDVGHLLDVGERDGRERHAPADEIERFNDVRGADKRQGDRTAGITERAHEPDRSAGQGRGGARRLRPEGARACARGLFDPEPLRSGRAHRGQRDRGSVTSVRDRTAHRARRRPPHRPSRCDAPSRSHRRDRRPDPRAPASATADGHAAARSGPSAPRAPRARRDR